MALEDEALKASIFQRLHPRAYFERFLSENVRPDGREFNAWRDVSLNVGVSVCRSHSWTGDIPYLRFHINGRRVCACPVGQDHDRMRCKSRNGAS
jgi:hypothetical protein